MSTTEHIALVPIEVMVNGQRYRREVEPRLLLVQLLREELRLTGTHIGCDTTYCGACTVQLNGAPIKSCTVLAVQADGGEILQCVYCTLGMLMSAHALLATNPAPNAKDIRKAIQGNLCRCTGYQNIFKAIEAAATELRGDG